MSIAGKVEAQKIEARGIRFSLTDSDREIARAYLYIMHNDLHQSPFGLLEDVYVDKNYRGSGLGTKLVDRVINAAREQNCYKLIATSRKSRPQVHRLYEKLGFISRGYEFRIDL